MTWIAQHTAPSAILSSRFCTQSWMQAANWLHATMSAARIAGNPGISAAMAKLENADQAAPFSAVTSADCFEIKAAA